MILGKLKEGNKVYRVACGIVILCMVIKVEEGARGSRIFTLKPILGATDEFYVTCSKSRLAYSWSHGAGLYTSAAKALEKGMANVQAEIDRLEEQRYQIQQKIAKQYMQLNTLKKQHEAAKKVIPIPPHIIKKMKKDQHKFYGQCMHDPSQEH